MCQNNHSGILLIKIECRRCFKIFYLCRSCYRGHAYCSEPCRSIARRDSHRVAQSKYRTGKEGRKANNDGARRRRTKQKQKSVADRGSTLKTKSGNMPPFSLLGKIVCLFCQVSGTVVMRFPRKEYGPASSAGFYRNPNPRRYHEYRKNIGSRPNSPDP